MIGVVDASFTVADALVILSGVEIAPATPCAHLAVCHDSTDCGMAKRFAYYHAPHGCWHVVGRASLLSLGSTMQGDPTGTWSAASAARMPTFWTPWRQDAYLLYAPGVYAGLTYWNSYQDAYTHGGRNPVIIHVTADLVTGDVHAVGGNAVEARLAQLTREDRKEEQL